MLYTSNLVVGLERGLDDPGFLTQIADETHTGVEFFLHVHSPEYVQKTAGIPAWLGERPRSAHGPFIAVEAASAEGSPEHAHMLDAYRYAFGVAQQLGSRHLVFHTNQRVIQAWEKDQAQRMCRRSIQLLLQMGAEFGVTLLIENLGIQKQGVCLFDEDAFIRLLEEYPAAGCLIDAGHLNVAGWDVERLLCALGGRIVGYHFHNNDGVNDSHRRIGAGVMDYERLMALYRRYTPLADITLEYGDDHGIAPSDIIADLRYVQARMQ